MPDGPEADGSQEDDHGRGRHASGDVEQTGKMPTEKRHRVMGFVATFLIIFVSTAAGSLIIDVPPSLPTDFWSLVISLGGAVLLTIAAVVATFFDKVWRQLSTAFVNLR